MDEKAHIRRIREGLDFLWLCGVKIPAPKGAPKGYVTISLGGSIIQTMGAFSFDALLEKVDGYLYDAKRNGKDVSVLDGTVVRS